MSNELSHIISKYFSNELNEISYFKHDRKSRKRCMDLEKFFSRLVDFESPDMYAVVDNEVLVLEHFEFDSSKSIKKSSLSKKENARIDRKIERMLESIEEEDGIVSMVETISHHPSYQNYKNNFTRIYNNHYNRIINYINNLKNEQIINDNLNIITAFFIEDTTPAGSCYRDKNNIYYINLLQTEFFCKLLKKAKLLDVVFFANLNNDIWFLDLKSIKKIKVLKDKFLEAKFYRFTPQTFYGGKTISFGDR